MLINFLCFSKRAQRFQALKEYYLDHDFSEDEATEAANFDLALEEEETKDKN